MTRALFHQSSVMLVFDAAEWAGRDVGDNSQFWHEASILKRYCSVRGDEYATVRFHHDGRISRGHLVDAMREAGS